MIPTSTVIAIHHNFQHLPESLNVQQDKALKLVHMWMLQRVKSKVAG